MGRSLLILLCPACIACAGQRLGGAAWLLLLLHVASHLAPKPLLTLKQWPVISSAVRQSPSLSRLQGLMGCLAFESLPAPKGWPASSSAPWQTLGLSRRQVLMGLCVALAGR